MSLICFHPYILWWFTNTSSFPYYVHVNIFCHADKVTLWLILISFRMLTITAIILAFSVNLTLFIVQVHIFFAPLFFHWPPYHNLHDVLVKYAVILPTWLLSIFMCSDRVRDIRGHSSVGVECRRSAYEMTFGTYISNDNKSNPPTKISQHSSNSAIEFLSQYSINHTNNNMLCIRNSMVL